MIPHPILLLSLLLVRFERDGDMEVRDRDVEWLTKPPAFTLRDDSRGRSAVAGGPAREETFGRYIFYVGK